MDARKRPIEYMAAVAREHRVKTVQGVGPLAFTLKVKTENDEGKRATAYLDERASFHNIACRDDRCVGGTQRAMQLAPNA